MVSIWDEYLLRPLVNGLVWIYNNWTEESLGWAIVYLTVLLRTVLLPLTIISQRNELRNEVLLEEIGSIQKSFELDHVAQKEQVRRLLKQRHVNPWAKFFSLGVQGIVLVVLYEVFVHGVTGERMLQILYPFVDFPGTINTIFFGFDLGAPRGIIGPSIVAVWLFLEVYFHHTKTRKDFSRSDLANLFLFPGAIFIVLWWLPLVKTLFVLTSMTYSGIVGQFTAMAFAPKKDTKKKDSKKKETSK